MHYTHHVFLLVIWCLCFEPFLHLSSYSVSGSVISYSIIHTYIHTYHRHNLTESGKERSAAVHLFMTRRRKSYSTSAFFLFYHNFGDVCDGKGISEAVLV
jgi:hypothetical protein